MLEGPHLDSCSDASQAGLLAARSGSSCLRPWTASALDRCGHASSSTACRARSGMCQEWVLQDESKLDPDVEELRLPGSHGRHANATGASGAYLDA